MKYTVDITDAALEDMDEIYDYIRVAFRAPDTAAAQYDRIADEILSLEEMPLRFGIPSLSRAFRRSSIGCLWIISPFSTSFAAKPSL